MFQSMRFAWGRWEDEWKDGKFSCVFHQAIPKDGWVEAQGLYEAEPGDTIDDLRTVEGEIAARTAVEACDGRLRVPEEFVELLSLMPSLVAEIAVNIREQCEDLESRPLIAAK